MRGTDVSHQIVVGGVGREDDGVVADKLGALVNLHGGVQAAVQSVLVHLSQATRNQASVSADQQTSEAVSSFGQPSQSRSTRKRHN